MTLAERAHAVITGISGLLPIVLPIGTMLTFFIPPLVLMYMFIASLGLQTFFIDIGTTITLPRLLAAIILFALLLTQADRLRAGWQRYPAREYLVAYLLFLLLSLIINLPFLPEKEIVTSAAPVNDTLLRGQSGRGFLQILTIALRASVPLFLLAIIQTPAMFQRVWKFFLVVTTGVCVYGLYQLYAYYHDLPAIYIYRGFHDPTGTFLGLFRIYGQGGVGGLRIFRISSLLGEPKDLAGFLLPVIFMLGTLLAAKRPHHFLSLFGKRLDWLLLPLFLLHLFTFAWTFSTGGWIAALFSIPIVIWYLQGSPPLRRILAGITFGIVILIIASLFVPHIRTIVNSRILERVGTSILENQAQGIPQLLDLIHRWPHTIFVGASPGGALLYERYLGSQIGMIRSLMDSGILGSALLILFLFKAFRAVESPQASSPEMQRLHLSLIVGLLATIVAFAWTTNVESSFALWMFLGLAAAFGATHGQQKPLLP